MNSAVAGRYASQTTVPVGKSRGEIEEILRRHGATEFASGWSETHDTLQFKIKDVTVRFVLPRPAWQDKRFTRDRFNRLRPAAIQQRLRDQADRQRWRGLYLVIRAKIEAVEAGIAIFEQEFLAFIVGPNGLTVGDIMIPRLQAGTMWPALPESTEAVHP